MDQQKDAAKIFAEKWAGRGYEKGEGQKFWLELLQTVYNVENPADFAVFEQQVKLDHTSFIDVMLPKTHVMIEQKGLNKSLTEPIKQSDGSLLKPIEQAKRYAAALPYSERPRWIISCNFAEFLIYNMETPNSEPEQVFLKDLPKEYYRLSFLVDTKNEHIEKEMEISIKAGQLVRRLYEALLKEYKNPDDKRTQQSLNMLCVRLVFCLYAEDAGLFGRHALFHDYMKEVPLTFFRQTLLQLFRVLDTPLAERDPYLNETLASFPYVNGGLFAEENLEVPQFTEEILSILLKDASEGFDWSEISPTIFGAVFESTLNPATRRAGGMHYTSIENIHKVIDPLFLDALRAEFDTIKETKIWNTKKAKLLALQEKMAALTFLDPSAGSGNFLTETYLSLRRLENDILREIHREGIVLGGIENPIRVSISQFYGIEINDFAATVARTALWIAESQMFAETEEIVHMQMDFLPLKSYANIHEGNALRTDWTAIVPKEKLNYMMGNPPFVGARIMSKEQKSDIEQEFNGWKQAGNLDYVAAWYKKAADLMQGTKIHTALVSTNSITQGENVPALWKPLMEAGIQIDFAHRTFRWDSESAEKAHVHCVIVGFSAAERRNPPVIYEGDRSIPATHVNAYLLDAPDVFVESRTKPLCNVPEIGIGNKPIDDGNYLFTEDEMLDFIKSEPLAKEYFRPWYGSWELIHRKPRYCLWLGDCPPNILNKMPRAKKRVEAVREFRSASKSAGTRKIADTPTRFHVENIPTANYIAIPKVSSERRRYVPMDYMDKNSMSSDLLFILQNATLYHFGVLTSNVHMAWMRAVCGRLEMRYRYSKNVVYNNFPWCNVTAEQKAEIAKTAEAILAARKLYPDATLADLYDDVLMPKELRAAHRNNDRAVLRAYRLPVTITESDCVKELLSRYEALRNLC